MNEAIAIGERAGVPVDIIHLKIADQSLWGRMPEIVALIDQARRRGVNVQANVYPYTRGNNDLVSIIPPWAHEGGKSAAPRATEGQDDPGPAEGGDPGGHPRLVQPLHGGGRRLEPDAHQRPAERANKRFQGQTMDAVIAARSAGMNPAPDPLDILFDFLIEESGRSARSTPTTPRRT